jgi:hypothetical protein
MLKKCLFNKELVGILPDTAPVRCNFSILARPNRFGGGVGAFLPHRARKRRHNAGVSAINVYRNSI